jgi:hypothetical protein
MSKLTGLIGKPKVYKIGDIELELSPRTMADIDLIMDLSVTEKRSSALSQLIIRSLKDAVPEATNEEINKVSFKYFKELSEAIIDVNGLKA